MAGYNPQRSRPRPVVAEDAPAPVDALLGTPQVESVVGPAVEPIVTEPVITEPVDDVIAEVVVEPVVEVIETTVVHSLPVPEAPYVPTQPSAAERSRTRLLLLAAAGVGAVVLAVVLRRRRRR